MTRPSTAYFKFALASSTANIKQITVKGILIDKITLVTICPNSGVPDVNSKIEPTLAIAAKQDISSKTPLLGVIYIVFFGNLIIAFIYLTQFLP
jgi:hypothetical protein